MKVVEDHSAIKDTNTRFVILNTNPPENDYNHIVDFNMVFFSFPMNVVTNVDQIVFQSRKKRDRSHHENKRGRADKAKDEL